MSNKKNISFLIDVYKEYKEKLGDKALPLRLIGEGPNLQEYKEKVKNAKAPVILALNAITLCTWSEL